MTKGWHNEFERHSLARQGIKTAVPKVAKSYSVPKIVKPKKSNKILSYSDSDAYEMAKDDITEQLKEEGVYPEDFDAELEKRMENISDYYDVHWDDFKMNLTEELKAKNPDGYWCVEGKHLDWRNSSGEKYIYAPTGEKLLEQIAPNTNDFSVDVFRNGAGLSMRIYHHDVPMGSLYILHKVSEKKFNKENGVND